MIVLDTNVVSAFMRTVPEGVVVAWLDRQPSQSVWTTTTTLFELRYGLALLPKGRRRAELEAGLHRAATTVLQGRLLSFDTEAAEAAAELAARRRRAGRPIEVHDAQIAGIAASRRATLATRNTADFDGLGLDLVNPWGAA